MVSFVFWRALQSKLTIIFCLCATNDILARFVPSSLMTSVPHVNVFETADAFDSNAAQSYTNEVIQSTDSSSNISATHAMHYAHSSHYPPIIIKLCSRLTHKSLGIIAQKSENLIALWLVWGTATRCAFILMESICNMVCGLQ